MDIFKKINSRIEHIIKKGHSRSIKAKKNILGSFFVKGVSIIVSLLVVPITINFLDTSLYGIWLTLSSIVAWIGYFDLGFTHGFRNKFAKAIAENRLMLAREYVSTTYFVVTCVFTFVFFVVFIFNEYIIWSDILNIDVKYDSDVSYAFMITIGFFCINMVLKIVTTMLLADQRTAMSGLVNTIGQVLSLFFISLISLNYTSDLSVLALVIGASPALVLFIFTIILFRGRYSIFRPSFSNINMTIIKDIVGIGGKFFLIQISWLIIYQSANIVVARGLGPEFVTTYNVQYKYFNIIYMFIGVILAPTWSAFTEAYIKSDYQWMRNTYNRLNNLWFIIFGVLILMFFLSPFLINFWIGGEVDVQLTHSFIMMLYFALFSRAAIYITLISGIGKIQLQTIVNIVLALIAIPVFIFFTDSFGLSGLILSTCIVPFVQCVVFHIQLNKLLKNTAGKVWDL